LPGLFEHVTPFPESNAHGVKGPDVFGKSVYRPFFFWLKGAKQPVPNDQNAAMVFIDLFYFCGMV
jgi:hypothetical protein